MLLVLECRQLYLLGGFVSCIAAYMSTKAVFETEVFIVHNGPAAVAHAPVNKSWSQDSLEAKYARLPCLLLFIEAIAMVSLTFSEVDALFSFQEISCGLPSLRALVAVVWPSVVCALIDQICVRFALVKIAASLFATVCNLRIPLCATVRSCCLGENYTLRQWLALVSIVLCASLAAYTFEAGAAQPPRRCWASTASTCSRGELDKHNGARVVFRNRLCLRVHIQDCARGGVHA